VCIQDRNTLKKQKTEPNKEHKFTNYLWCKNIKQQEVPTSRVWFFLFFNFEILKLWSFFLPKISKICRIYTFLKSHFFPANLVPRTQRAFKRKRKLSWTARKFVWHTTEVPTRT
jgi:hypothetical protein